MTSTVEKHFFENKSELASQTPSFSSAARQVDRDVRNNVTKLGRSSQGGRLAKAAAYTAELAALQPKQFELEMAADNQRNMLHPNSAKLVNVFT